MKKKIIVLILVAVLSFTTLFGVNAVYYSDITPSIGTDTLNAINFMSDNGYIVGTGNNKFSPNNTVTKGMIASLIYRYSGETTTYPHPFTDVSSSAYYSNAVGWANYFDIVTGETSTTFSPNLALTRERYMNILYNFALYEEYYFNIPELLNNTLCDDYDEVSSNCVEAINWALDNSILEINNRTLGPNEIVTRSDMALYLHRYEVCVRKISLEYDVFSFSNSPEDFGYEVLENEDYTKEPIDITVADKNRLFTVVDNYYGYGSTKASAMKDMIEDHLDYIPWYGSCYGLSIVTILDKLGYIAFNENFSDADTMSGVPKASESDIVRSVINVHHFTQIFNEAEYYPFASEGRTYSGGLQLLWETVNERKPILFSFSTESGGSHAIVIYDGYVDLDGDFRLDAYDNNNPLVPAVIKISANFSNCTINDERIYAFRFENNFDFYSDFFDYDGYANDLNTYYGTTPAMCSNDTTVDLFVTTDRNFNIENAEGEILSFQNGVASGNLEVFDINLIVLGEEKTMYKFTVEESNTFTCDNNNSLLHIIR